jgi:hypothetical protein
MAGNDDTELDSDSDEVEEQEEESEKNRLTESLTNGLAIMNLKARTTKRGRPSTCTLQVQAENMSRLVTSLVKALMKTAKYDVSRFRTELEALLAAPDKLRAQRAAAIQASDCGQCLAPAVLAVVGGYSKVSEEELWEMLAQEQAQAPTSTSGAKRKRAGKDEVSEEELWEMLAQEQAQAPTSTSGAKRKRAGKDDADA